eukprot:4718438-Pyramimonas_sp.AAC.1
MKCERPTRSSGCPETSGQPLATERARTLAAGALLRAFAAAACPTGFATVRCMSAWRTTRAAQGTCRAVGNVGSPQLPSAAYDELLIQNSKCDNCLMAFTFCMQQLACICTIIAMLTNDDSIDQAANFVDLIADIVWCSVCACMQTQHKIQLDARDKGLAPTGAQHEIYPVMGQGGPDYATNGTAPYVYSAATQPPYAQPAPYAQGSEPAPYAQAVPMARPANAPADGEPVLMAQPAQMPGVPLAQPAFTPVTPAPYAQPVAAPAAGEQYTGGGYVAAQPPHQQNMI